MTKKTCPSTSSAPWMGTMFGCDIAPAVRVSRRNRSRSAGSPASCGGSVLMATSRSRRRSRARKTMPIPPRPIIRFTAYRAEIASANGREASSKVRGSGVGISMAVTWSSLAVGVGGMSIRHNARTCAAGSPICDGWETRKKDPLVNKRILSCVSVCSADDEVDLLLDRIVRAVQCRDGGVHAGLREATPGFVDFHGVAGTECLVPDTLREHAPVGPLPDFSAKGIDDNKVV